MKMAGPERMRRLTVQQESTGTPDTYTQSRQLLAKVLARTYVPAPNDDCSSPFALGHGGYQLVCILDVPQVAYAPTLHTAHAEILQAHGLQGYSGECRDSQKCSAGAERWVCCRWECVRMAEVLREGAVA